MQASSVEMGLTRIGEKADHEGEEKPEYHMKRRNHEYAVKTVNAAVAMLLLLGVLPNLSSAEEGKPRKENHPVALSKYKPRMKEICELLDLDGERPVFAAALQARADGTNDCYSCKSFFKVFATACTPHAAKKIMLRKVSEPTPDPEGTPPPTPTPEKKSGPAADPRVAVITAISEFFVALSTEDFSVDLAPHLAALEEGLTDSRRQTPLAVEYFSTVTAAIKSSFTVPKAAAPVPTPAPEKSKEQLDDLFQR